MRSLILFPLTWIFTILIGCTNSSSEANLAQMPADSLWVIGNKLLNESRLDSALIYLTLLADRADSANDSVESLLSLNALNTLGYIYFFDLHDYDKSIEYLVWGLSLAKKHGYAQLEATIYLNLGNSVQVADSRLQASDRFVRCSEYYGKTFDISSNLGWEEGIFGSLTNLINISFWIKSDSLLHRRLDSFSHLQSQNDYHRNYLELYSSALNSYLADDDQSAISLLDSLQVLARNLGSDRLELMAIDSKAQILAQELRTEEARTILEKENSLANGKMPDVLPEIYRAYADMYARTGEVSKHNHWLLKYYAYKDSLENIDAWSSIRKADMQINLRKSRGEVNELLKKRRVQNIVIVLSSAFLIILSILIYILIRKNKALRLKNRMLYNASLSEMNLNTSETENSLKSNDEDLDNTQTKQKYKESLLSDDEISDISENITKVFQTEAIFSPDFSLDTLARLIGNRPRVVSQVISMQRGKTFKKLLVEYRIKEVCKLIIDSDIDRRLTMEAIGKNVGFKSRSAFYDCFKKETGLTPTEFIKLSRKS